MIAAFTFLVERRRDRDNHDFLSLSALAMQGGGDAINKILDGWQHEMD